jgi:hypothetical protein
MAVTAPPILSEGENPLGKAWRACVYAAGMMAAYVGAGGAAIFPKGYTGTERNLLEASDTRPDNTGATLSDLNVALKARYGRTMSPIRGSLASALDTPGTALVVLGTYSRLPERLRLSSFIGPHAVTVIPQGGGRSLWLDPIAPSGAQAKLVDNSTILAFAWGAGSAMQVKAGEWAAGGSGQEITVTQATLRELGIPSDPTHIFTQADIWKIAMRATGQSLDRPFDAGNEFYRGYAKYLLGQPVSKMVADWQSGVTYSAPNAIPDIPGMVGGALDTVTALAAYLIAVLFILFGLFIYSKDRGGEPTSVA